MIGESGGFVTFQDISFGLRALAVDLHTKITNGYNTVEKIIYRWAPPEDNNDTEAYVNNVCSRTGYSRDQELTASAETLHKLMSAIIQQEIGTYSSYISGSDIDEGIRLIGGDYANAGSGSNLFTWLIVGGLVYVAFK